MHSLLRNLLRCSLTAAGIACCAHPARGGWGVDPVVVSSTAADIPIVEGCSDGASGAFVAWQEEATPGQGVLRVQHLLPTGDLDPTWPAEGAVACGVLADRSELVVLPDRLGGLYLLWKEGATLYANRLQAGGAVASGWPARGRQLGQVFHWSPRPSAIQDGANGFYATWVASAYTAVAVHLGPANTGAGGWPDYPRTIAPANGQYDFPHWPQLALATDGGVFVAWASASADTAVSPSGWRLRRLDSAGLDAPGWSGQVRSFGSFDRGLLGDRSDGSLLAMSPDGRGGVFLMIGNPVGSNPYGNGAILETRVYRVRGDGQEASDWPAGGSAVEVVPNHYWAGDLPDASYRVAAGGRDGVLIGTPVFYTHTTWFGFLEGNADGQWKFKWSHQGELVGHEVAWGEQGGVFVANFFPTGPYSRYAPYAHLEVSQVPAPPVWEDWREYHTDLVVQWYGDIGLAPTEDGGAVFFWSQVREHVGLFARRFSSSGEVTWVKRRPRPVPGWDGLRFVAGEGVRATFSVPGSARFDLFDLAGRRIASRQIEAGVRELTIAGTEALPSGLYFGRLIAGADALTAKLIVTR